MSNNREGYKSELSINNLESLLENKNYKNFWNKNKEIQSKYDKRLFEYATVSPKRSIKEWYLEEGIKQWREYIKEISEEMLKPNSDYQKFTWDILSDKDKEVRERMSTSKPDNLHHY